MTDCLFEEPQICKYTTRKKFTSFNQTILLKKPRALIESNKMGLNQLKNPFNSTKS